jgi:hypothetical protein
MDVSDIICLKHSLYKGNVQNIRSLVKELTDDELVQVFDYYLQNFIPSSYNRVLYPKITNHKCVSYDKVQNYNLHHLNTRNANILRLMQHKLCSNLMPYKQPHHSIITVLPVSLLSAITSYMSFYERNTIIKLISWDFWKYNNNHNMTACHEGGFIIPLRMDKLFIRQEMDFRRIFQCIKFITPLSFDINHLKYLIEHYNHKSNV